MSKSNRRSIRTPLRADVKLSHPDIGYLDLHTGDISETGAYILTEGNRPPEIGTLVTVQVQGIAEGDAPAVKMRIVRSDNDGIGLEFVTE